MNQHHPPHSTPTAYLLVRFEDLKAAWAMLAAPDKTHYIDETIEALRTTQLTQSREKAVFSMIAATAWLVEDGTGS